MNLHACSACWKLAWWRCFLCYNSLHTSAVVNLYLVWQWSKEGKQAAARQAAAQNPPKAEEAAALKAENETEKQMGSAEALGQPG